MKALSIDPEYAMKKERGEKTIKCRSWTTKYRGDIVICSTAKKEKGAVSGHALAVVNPYNVRTFQWSDCRNACMDSAPLDCYAYQVLKRKYFYKEEMIDWDNLAK